MKKEKITTEEVARRKALRLGVYEWVKENPRRGKKEILAGIESSGVDPKDAARALAESIGLKEIACVQRLRPEGSKGGGAGIYEANPPHLHL